MPYPLFYDKAEKITLYDPLAEFLGSFDAGLIKVRYRDIAEFAGHSCPTVAGAYLMSVHALKALYPDSTPVRGEIKVAFKESLEEGVAGVIANVITNITGATESSGFKGLNGKFVRHNLMAFNAPITSSVRFTRIDTNQSVDVFYNPSIVPADPAMQPLMQKMMKGAANDEEKKHFGTLWQARVEKILLHTEQYPELLTLKAV
ncbi:MAG: hypothetical protein K0U47_05515 [Epsilonproteobacteria bacterium]|nr:hypothetical protein [Campylobacterota bacterium]